jgi:hypothetical protein
MARHSITVALIAGVLAGAVSGCLLVAAGAAAGGTIVYVKGELQETLAAPVDKAAVATERALAALEMKADAATKDGLVAQYVAHLADTTRVVIQLESRGEAATRVGIRVGLVGDRALSERILAAIRQELAK